MKTLTKLCLLAIAVVIGGCSGGGLEEAPDPCAKLITITISDVVAATQGQSNGSFTATATGGNGDFQYSIDGRTLFNSGTFSNLAAGDYTVVARDNQGCIRTTLVVIEEGDAPISSFANEVFPIMQAKCATAGCHVSGGNAPFVIEGYDDVQPRAALIRTRVSNGTMPPSGATGLSDAEVRAIISWVDGGAQDN